MLREVETRLGAATILVNNAGITRDNLLLRMKDEEWDEVMATNLKPAYRLAKAVLRGMMKARRGRIIQIGSVVGASGNPGQANYAAAKAGLIGLPSRWRRSREPQYHRQLRRPGLHRHRPDEGAEPAQRDALLSRIPLNRLGTPEDIADAVLFLASPRAAYITGATLHVNGGMLMP